MTFEHRNDEGKLHCDYGPAFEYADGSKEWHINGLRHRIDGPAVEYANGDKQWFSHGVKLDVYYSDFGCASKKITTRAEALERLDSKERLPEVRKLYMKDIDELFSA